ncbi:MAG: hypothetical protein ABSH16_02480, partial [Sedimentisphaerales bacterium]
TDGKPIGDYVKSPAGDNYKLVVYVPVASAAQVADAVFAAGAGHIGNYSHCGFGAQGQGSFLPLEGTRPAIGARRQTGRGYIGNAKGAPIRGPGV